jgi:opacity protein-like surface antigen
MIVSEIAMRYVKLSTIILLIVTMTMAPAAYAEMYIGGQFGTSVTGNTLTNVDLTDFTPNASMSDRTLAPSALIGFKLGYYFPQARWFGLETEAYHMTPHIKQQLATVTVPPPGAVVGGTAFSPGTATSVISGDHFRVITWVPVNLMFRYHKTRLQPYVGFGPAVFMGRITTTIPQFAGAQNSTRLGLNAKAGLEYFFTRHVTAFAEVKWNYTTFDFSGTSSGAFAFRATYNPLLAAVGLSYHF